MMSGNLIVFALLAGSTIVFEPEQVHPGPGPLCALFESKVGADAVSFKICEPQLSGTPSWTQPEAKEPPVSVSEAVAASKAQLTRHFPKVKHWDLVDVKLHTLFAPDKWYYLVSWRPAKWRSSGQGERVDVGVLMNGQAVELTVAAEVKKDKTSIK